MEYKQLFYDKDLLELKDEVKRIFNCGKKVLLVAPTGSGKTTLTSNLFASNTSFRESNIMLTPYRIQNIQNQEKGLKAVIGKKKIEKAPNYSSVYDMANNLNKFLDNEGLKAKTIVIDEAHTLVDDSYFRYESIQQVLSLKGETEIFMTATPQRIKHIYDFDLIIECVPKCESINFNKHKLLILNDKTHKMQQILQLIELEKAKGKKVLLHLNSKESIYELKKLLEFRNIKVGVLTAECKGTELYNQIATGYIPDNIEVLLVTKVLEAGLSIMNENTTSMLYIDKSTNLNVNRIGQTHPRLRLRQETAYTIINDKEKLKNLKEFKEIETEVTNLLEKYKSGYQIIYENHLSSLSMEEATKQINKDLAFSNNPNLPGGVLIAENGEIKISKERLYNFIFTKYDSQLYGDKEKLLEEIKPYVRAEEHTIELFGVIEDKQLTDFNNEIEEEIKTTKEDLKETLLKIIINRLKNSDEFVFIDDFIRGNMEMNMLPPEDIKLYELLEANKYMKVVKKCLKADMTIEEVFKLIVECDTKTDIEEKALERNYIQRNKVPLKVKAKVDQYYICRSIFDSDKDTWRYVTNEMLTGFYIQLIKHKAIKRIAPTKKQIKEKVELSLKDEVEKAKNDLEKVITQIYTSNRDKDGYLRIKTLK